MKAGQGARRGSDLTHCTLSLTLASFGLSRTLNKQGLKYHPVSEIKIPAKVRLFLYLRYEPHPCWNTLKFITLNVCQRGSLGDRKGLEGVIVEASVLCP